MLRICEGLELGVFKDVSTAHLHLAEDVEGWAGINPFEKRQASAAVDLVTLHLQRNERGLPPYAKMVQVFGEWTDGVTRNKFKEFL